MQRLWKRKSSANFYQEMSCQPPAVMILYSSVMKCWCVGMADEADSKSVAGNRVWVQVPPPAVSKIAKFLVGWEFSDYLIFRHFSVTDSCRKAASQNKSVFVGFRFPAILKPPYCVILFYISLEVYINFRTVPYTLLFLSFSYFNVIFNVISSIFTPIDDNLTAVILIK